MNPLIAQVASQQRALVTRHQVVPGGPKALRATRAVSQRARLVVSAASKKNDYPLPSNLLFPSAGELPPDGKTIQLSDEYCNPAIKFCRTVVHTWEDQCDACGGDGNIRTVISGRKGRTYMSTCIKCSGLGFLRHSSSRVEPDFSHLNNGSGQFTLLRPKDDPEKRKRAERASKLK